MRSIRHFSFLILCTLFVTGVAAAQKAEPASTVRSFYALDSRTSQVFNRRNLEIRRPHLSARLYGLFRDELRKQDALKRSNPDDKPFFGDGFPFRPTDEPCSAKGRSFSRRYSVLEPGRYKGSRAEVPVRFSYPRPCTAEPLNYKVKVVRVGSVWVIDDIVYEDGSTLSDSMKNNRN